MIGIPMAVRAMDRIQQTVLMEITRDIMEARVRQALPAAPIPVTEQNLVQAVTTMAIRIPIMYRLMRTDIRESGKKDSMAREI